MNSKILTYVLLMATVSGLIGTGYFYSRTQTLQEEKTAIQDQIEKIGRPASRQDNPGRKDVKARPAAGKKEDAGSTGDEAPATEANIIVESPAEDEAITSPVTVSGQARTFENTVNVKIKDDSGNLLAESYTTATGEMGRHSSFSTTVEFDKGTSKYGSIEVFQYSAKDGTEIDKVVVPVAFQ